MKTLPTKLTVIGIALGSILTAFSAVYVAHPLFLASDAVLMAEAKSKDGGSDSKSSSGFNDGDSKSSSGFNDGDSKSSWSGDTNSKSSWSGDGDSKSSWSGDTNSKSSWSGDTNFKSSDSSFDGSSSKTSSDSTLSASTNKVTHNGVNSSKGTSPSASEGTLQGYGTALNGNKYTQTVSSCGSNCTEYTYTEYDAKGQVSAQQTRRETSNDGDSDGFGPVGPIVGEQPVSPCVQLPDLDVIKLDLVGVQGTPAKLLHKISSSDVYTPEIEIRNIGCISTHGVLVQDQRGRTVNWYPYGTDLDKSTVTGIRTGTTGFLSRTTSLSFADYITTNNYTTTPVYNNRLPYGADGTFPLRMQVDFNNDGTIDWEEYAYSIPALFGSQSARVLMPDINFPEGNHRIDIYIDMPAVTDSNNFGCSQSDGCIREPAVNNNTYSVMVSVIEPRVELDVFYYEREVSGAPQGGWGAMRRGDNDLSKEEDLRFTGNNFGLHWTEDRGLALSQGIVQSTCIGTSFAENGTRLNDFNGQRSSPLPYVLQRSQYDHRLTTPPVGSYHTYQITCGTIFGGTVSHEIIISNGADISNLLRMRPAVQLVDVTTGQTLNSLDFTVTNTSIDAPNTAYTIEINGVPVGNGVINVPNSGISPFTDTSINWTAPASAVILPLSLCITRSNLINSPRCDGNYVRVTESIGPTGGQPSISVAPSIVRRGSNVEVIWNTNGNTNCVISPDIGVDVYGSSRATLPVTTQKTFMLSCSGWDPVTATVRTLPVMYES